MPRQKRELSEGSVYHVVQRGVGQQILFEDDADRRYFLHLLQKYISDGESDILAWCLMSNHTHLLVRMEMDALSRAMKAIGVSYARYFNDRYARSGHLFQDRFYSEAVKDDAQLMVTVRYIHANPLKARIADSLAFPWSSYALYADDAEEDCALGATDGLPEGLVSTDVVLAIFGGTEALKRFHQEDGSNDRCLDIKSSFAVRKVTEDQALEIAKQVVGPERVFALKGLPKAERDAALARLKGEGLSARQIVRITGVSLGAISRA